MHLCLHHNIPNPTYPTLHFLTTLPSSITLYTTLIYQRLFFSLSISSHLSQNSMKIQNIFTLSICLLMYHECIETVIRINKQKVLNFKCQLFFSHWLQWTQVMRKSKTKQNSPCPSGWGKENLDSLLFKGLKCEMNHNHSEYYLVPVLKHNCK